MQGRKLTDKKTYFNFRYNLRAVERCPKKGFDNRLYWEKLCFVLPFGHKSNKLAAFVLNKNCAICIENLKKSDNEDIFKQTCSIRVVNIVNVPAQNCCFKFTKIY